VPICLVCLSCCRLLFCLACRLLVCLSGRPLTCPAGVWPAPGCLFTLPVFCLSVLHPAADCLAIRSVCLSVCHGCSILLLLTAYICPAAHVSCLSCYSRPTAHTSRLSGSLMSDLTQITPRGQVVTRRFKYLQYLRGFWVSLGKVLLTLAIRIPFLRPYSPGSYVPIYRVLMPLHTRAQTQLHLTYGPTLQPPCA
jgi:hypothetical protein